MFTVRSVNIPIPRVNGFKARWMQIYTPLVDVLDLQVRMNLKVPCIDLRTENDENIVNLEKGVQFINAILDGFTPDQAVDLLKDDVMMIKFNISEIKHLTEKNASRAVGRIIGREGKVKAAIEKTMGVHILIKEDEVFIIGDEYGIRRAKESICRLVMGAHPGSILNKLKVVASKQKKEFYGTIYLNENKTTH